MKNRMLILAVMMLSAIVVRAATWTNPYTGLTWTYTVSGGEASVGSGSIWSPAIATSTTGDIFIPSTLGDYPVTSIGKGAFRSCGELTDIKIMFGRITSIGDLAFDGCKSLTTVQGMLNVKSIGSGAFQNCSSLTDMTIPKGVKIISSSTFAGCSSLTSVTMPEYGITNIGKCAFQNCTGLESIEISEDVTSISESTFEGCSGLKYVWMPSCVTNIGRYAFYGCGELKDIGNLSNVKSIGYRAFGDCTALGTGVVIAYGCVLTANDCPATVVLPSSVRLIADGAFYGCTGLKSVTIPIGVTSIGASTFERCSGLASVTIPSSVTSIGGGAFYGCGGLKSVAIPSSVTSISSGAFMYCGGLTSVTLPDGVTSVATYLFLGCDGLTSVTLPESVTSIGDGAFERCSALRSMTIPAGVTSIDYRAFALCSELTNVVFGGNAPVCGDDAFKMVKSGCTATVYEGTTGWDDDGDGKWQGLTLVHRKRPSVIPGLGDNATKEQIADALKGSADEKLTACITNAANYNAYRTWAETIGAQSVKESPNAWVSFALGSNKLLEEAPTDEDLTVEKFEPSTEAGKFDFTVSVAGVDVGSDAQKENLKQVFGLEGASSLDAGAFSSGNIDLTFGTPAEGKIKITAGPKNADAKTFFMKVKVNP